MLEPPSTSEVVIRRLHSEDRYPSGWVIYRSRSKIPVCGVPLFHYGPGSLYLSGRFHKTPLPLTNRDWVRVRVLLSWCRELLSFSPLPSRSPHSSLQISTETTSQKEDRSPPSPHPYPTEVLRPVRMGHREVQSFTSGSGTHVPHLVSRVRLLRLQRHLREVEVPTVHLDGR